MTTNQDHLATFKAISLSALLPLTLMVLVGQVARFFTLSLELSFIAKVLWFLPELCALTGFAMLVMATLEWTRPRRGLHTVLFTLYSVCCILLICLEGAALNFSKVTGSLLDAAMLEYALTNTRESWGLINGSTPVALKITLAIVSLACLTLPHILRRKLTPLTRAITHPGRLIMGSLVLLAAPFLIARVLGDTPRQANATLPGTYAVITSMFAEDPLGVAQSLDYSTGEAVLVPTKKPARNVVLILLESTRASATTPYNPKLDTTPFLAELATKSIVAKHAYVVTPHTSKAIMTTGCGVDPYLSVEILEANQAGLPHRCMANLFARAGYSTAFFQSATQRFEKREGLVRNMGFEEFYPLETFDKKGFEEVNYFGVEDDVMLKPSMDWVGKQKDPFFITYLTLTPHHDYLAPTRYGRHQFAEEDEFNRYLNSVRYVDHFVKNVIDGLKAQGVYEDTIIAVLGDHGEGFGEHKRFQHDKVIYEEGLTIPFIVHDPSRPELTRRVKAPVSQRDLMPTLIELSQHKLVGGTLPGMSLLRDDIPTDRQLRSYCWSRNTCMALVQGRTKLIHFFGQQPDEFYDLDADPLEQHSLPERVEQDSVNQLLNWRASTNKAYRDHHDAYSKDFVTLTRKSPSHKIDAKFDEAVRIYGYDLVTTMQSSGDTRVELTTHIEAINDIEPGWKLFVHGIDARGKMANLDHIPVGDTLPVEDFEGGTFIEDRFIFTIPKTAPKGPYKVLLGIWHPKTGRMKARLDGELVPENRLPLVTIDITR